MKSTTFNCALSLFEGGGEERFPDDGLSPIPPYLLGFYSKLIAAEDLGNLPMSIMIEAALCRSALTANEDDRVRVACVQQLLNARSSFLELILFGLLFDEDELMRQTAVEGLALIRSENLKQALSIVSDDEFKDVPDLLSKALAGDYESIKLYNLDPPPS